jgi:single-stranded DNA-binding protein
MARLAVSLPCNAADGQATFWLGVIAFGKQADALAKHVKGDLVSVAGNMQLNQWKEQDGTHSRAMLADNW